MANREFTKSGYVYIYVSNESKDFKVYFDNLKVTHIRGPLLSEEGYYPFGMTMSAISSSAGTVAKNDYKFNAGTELTESFDINYYETYFRQYDAQLGRFTGVDALAEQTLSWSPYQFGYNNPEMFNDPSGLQADYSDFWKEILSFIGNPKYPNGITFTNKDGTFYGTPYNSEADAFLDGINLIERTGGWGKAGVKYKSYAEALNDFSLRFGYLPPIIIKASNQRDMYGHTWLVINNWDDVYRQLNENGYSGFGHNRLFFDSYLHFQFGLNKDMHINTYDIDFEGITQRDLVKRGDGSYRLDFYSVKRGTNEALALGKIILIPRGGNKFSIQPNKYDFNIEWKKGITQRNTATAAAALIHYSSYPIIPIVFGGSFWIYFDGTVTLKP